MVLMIQLSSLTAGAIEGELTGEARFRIVNPYVWRGVLTTDGTVVQPEVTLALNGFTLNAWGTWDWEGTDETSARTRVDLSLDYTHQTEALNIRGGFIFYAYHDDHARVAEDTYEILAEVSANSLLSPAVTVFYDLGTIDSFYGLLSVDHTFEAFEWADLGLQAKLGIGAEKYKQASFGAEDDDTISAGLIDLRLSASLLVFLTEQWFLVPEVEYISLVDSDLRTLVEDADEDADHIVDSVAAIFLF
jgi:hypothetical protein